MRNLLILESNLPYPVSHGGVLRMFNLARELSRHHTCHLAVFKEAEPIAEPLRPIFRSFRFFPPPRSEKTWRHLFRSTKDRFWKPSFPDFFRTTVDSLQDLIESHDIDTVLAASIHVSEFLRPLQHVGKVVDACDCLTLAHERAALYGISGGWMDPRREGERLDFHRIRRIESGLTRYADLVTTISPVDQARLRILNAYREEAIQVVPNGVSLEFLMEGEEQNPEQERAIIFWGVLDYPPNETAVRYFYERVFVPFLRSKDIKWYIVGRNPPPGILEIGERETSVAVVGFVEDLIGLVRRIPIVINPMVIGSGLKNKVLEAFALNRLVISTSLGVEALEVENGIDCIVADTPDEFARRIVYFLDRPWERQRIAGYAQRLVLENYTWEKVVARFEHLVRKYASAESEEALEI
jgi:glycosyltransferase involved in cell wall biosynthesis